METKTELKIIADHLRSSCFLIADGILPSNEGRGYVLRRIMRRAMRQIHKLGAKQAVMYKLVDSLIKEMGKAYPELSRARDTIIDTLKIEEEKFRETLEKGLKILKEELDIMLSNANVDSKFSGKTAFKLYDTYGFPLDLTQDILKEKNIEVNEEAFNKEMESQRQRARKNWSGSGETAKDTLFFDLKEKYGETKFLGYDSLKSNAKILAIIKDGKEIDELKESFPKAKGIATKHTKESAIIILDQTPFYATSGGQKGDNGILNTTDNGFISISETIKLTGSLFGHLVSDSGNSELKKGDEVTTQVDILTRKNKGANHSATHLMHKSLKQVLGNSISQKGSNVDSQYFTFDFNFNRAMSAEELAEVEDSVNNWIKESSLVETNLMNLEKARETGAEALFGEKYDSEVRVVSMGPSVELCGGTHVNDTSEIEAFKIISEKSVASGIRRIEARTSSGLKEYLDEQEEKLKILLSDLHSKISNKNLELSELGESEINNNHIKESDPGALEDILKQKNKELDRLKKKILLSGLNNLKSENIGDINLLSHAFESIDAKDLREITNDLKSKPDFVNSHIFALFGCKDGKVSTIIAVSSNLTDKFDASKLIRPVVEAIGGKGGGGKKDLAMGGGVNKQDISKAVETLKNLVN